MRCMKWNQIHNREHRNNLFQLFRSWLQIIVIPERWPWRWSLEEWQKKLVEKYVKAQFLAHSNHSKVIFNEKDKQQFKPCSFIVQSQLLILWEKKWTQSGINYPLPLKLCMDVGARTVTNHILTSIGFKRFNGSLPYSLSNFTKICSLCFFDLDWKITWQEIR